MTTDLIQNRKLIQPPGTARIHCTAEERFAKFERWSAMQRKTCAKHPGFALAMADDNRNGVHKVFAPPSREGGQREELPGVFDFFASMRCPACWCELAKCPPEFQQTSFSSFVTSTAEQVKFLALASDYADQIKTRRRGFALFIGKPGTGKTRLACNIIAETLFAGPLYVRQATLTAALRASYNIKSPALIFDDNGELIEEPSPLDAAQQAGLLVLDEIGCTAPARDEIQMLDEIIKCRYDHGKPTVFISNLPLDQLKNHLGDALADRIRHATGNGKFIFQTSGKSYRCTAGRYL
jgi:DNA replication protein DnaC